MLLPLVLVEGFALVIFHEYIKGTAALVLFFSSSTCPCCLMITKNVFI